MLKITKHHQTSPNITKHSIFYRIVEEVEIKTYGKGELASLYMPGVQQATARRVLMSWIENNPKLKTELYEAGYRERAVLLTPKQVGIIFKHVGRP